MPRVRALTGLKVYLPKKPKKLKDGTEEARWSKLGRVHGAVFSPDGLRLVGIAVKRPDIVFMFEREDSFVALDSFVCPDAKTIQITRPDDGMGSRACKRLSLDWDRCIMWAGMDAKSTDGKLLGYINDAEFDKKTGAVSRFFCTENGASTALLGDVQIDASMLKGYYDGAMIVDTQGSKLQHEGGLAGAAGEKYARAKIKGEQVGKQVGEATGKAVDKGSYALGKAIGKAKKQVKKTTGSKKGMFAAFKEEFDKANK